MLADGKRSLLHKPDNRLLLRGVVRIECASRVLLKDEVQKLDEFLFLQVGERLEDALSDLLLQRRVGHARATSPGFSLAVSPFILFCSVVSVLS